MGKRKWKYPTEYTGEDGKRHNHRLYGIWRSMLSRCYRASHVEYSSYGGRGITVCEEWLSYDNFYEWAMANGYDETAERGLCTLDRIDVNSNYLPKNCRFVDMKTQQRNKQNSVLIEGKTLAEISEVSGLNLSMLTGRYYRHGYKTIAELTKPSGLERKAGEEILRETRTKLYVEGIPLKELAKSHGINYTTVFARYRRGKRTLEELIKPVREGH